MVRIIGLVDAASVSLPVTDLIPPVESDPPQVLAESKDDNLKGLYVPDNIEKLYDDGSYITEASPLPLIDSPYGLVPSGSGLEGQYVPDNLEKRYDDGLYKPDLIPTFQTPLFDTPYGKVLAGSGLEGQYFPNNTEKLFDDGLYKDEEESDKL
ncbi:hypothetical protein NQ314_012507 [Rhamnusium bicolor]|uniref:Uncharacterized protein n=1 Tax=Rhamnusium bicolor TaxID=1586634 RepID=A0AAV8XAN7_9CUCU|nr:hypothetical protein NQ314_012507 [Rhamnusium bicolor]